MSGEAVQSINKKNLTIARENVGYTTREVTDKVCGKKIKADRVKEFFLFMDCTASPLIL